MKLRILTLVFAILAINVAVAQKESNPTTIKLVETPGEFATKELTLKPGAYQFEVTNKGIDHEVAFFLQKEEDKGNKDFATAIPNSGIAKLVKDGESSKTGVVTLQKGTYVYSCPLNPTPHYKIVVK